MKIPEEAMEALPKVLKGFTYCQLITDGILQDKDFFQYSSSGNWSYAQGWIGDSVKSKLPFLKGGLCYRPTKKTYRINLGD